MEIYNKLGFVPVAAVALGMFDGVHAGHRSIISRAVALAKETGGKSAVFTFANHPLTVLAEQSAPRIICSPETKARIMREMGVDVLFNVTFTKEFSRITPENFLAMLRDNIAPRFVVTGANYTFGAKGMGNKRTLLRLANKFDFAAEICPTVTALGKTVSSTRIRESIIDGDLPTANALLAAPFTYGGRVVHGDRRGRTIGFPTANLIIEKHRAILKNGAYAAFARINLRSARQSDNDNEEIFPALANVGDNPTFSGKERRLEVNVQNFSRDIYGQYIEVEFLAKLRDEQKFAGADELIKQLKRDRENAAAFWR